jgi:subtilase family serine protease
MKTILQTCIILAWMLPAICFSQKSYIDLVMENAAIDPNSAELGATIQAECQVRNTGNNTAPQSILAYVLSRDNMPDYDDLVLKTENIGDSRGLPAGATSSHSTELTMPLDIKTGSYYIIFVADAGEEISEPDEVNNFSALPIELKQGKPDLTVTNPAIQPERIITGESGMASCRIENQGDHGANACFIAVYLSNDKYFDEQDLILNSGAIDGLDAGQSLEINMDITIPQDNEWGLHYIFFYVDSENDINESNEDNNRTYVQCYIDPTPRAEFSLRQAEISPERAYPGWDLETSVLLKNYGDIFVDSVSIQYYLSIDGEISEDDTFLDTDMIYDLYPDVLYEIKNKVTLPADVGYADQLYIIFFVDPENIFEEQFENDNQITDWIRVMPPSPDLSILFVETSADTIVQGGELTVGYVIKNIGQAPSGQCLLKFGLGENNSDDQISLGSDTIRALNIDETEIGERKLTIPDNMQAETWYLILRVDFTDQIDEINEKNNRSTETMPLVILPAPVYPDLIITGCIIIPGTVAPQDVVQANTYLRNEGEAPSGSSRLRFYLSEDQEFQKADDRAFGVTSVSGINPDEQKFVQNQLIIPYDLTAGEWYVILVADDENEVQESDETNNIGMAVLNVNVTSVEQNSSIPETFTFEQNYPNPFNASTQLQFSLPRPTHIRIDLFSDDGRFVETIINTFLPPGYYSQAYDASHIASGSYYCRLQSEEFTRTVKWILIK